MGDSQLQMTAPQEEQTQMLHKLLHKWQLWAHLPHDTDWSLKSYKSISNIESVEEIMSLYDSLPDQVIKNCMLFLMLDGVNPTWEDPRNAKGGCFSYKISNTSVVDVWRKLSYILVGESIISNINKNNITGITISPKKNFCIIKIWMSDCNNQDPTTINYFNGIDSRGCLFKKFAPEY